MSLIATVLQRRILYWCLIALFVVTIVVQAAVFQDPQLMGRDAEITDFTAYHIAGDMALEGRAVEAYDWKVPFTAVVAALATIPIGISYLLFASVTLLFFLAALWRLCGKWSAAGLIFVLPAVIVNARCGQNGFLTAGLIGVFLIYFRTEWFRSGLALGAMVVKPHLAVAISLVSLLRWSWGRILVAAAVVIGSSMIATLVLGPEIWSAFLQATRDGSKFMSAGNYPLDRMTSIYAMLSRFGIKTSMALAAHVAMAIGCLLAVWRAYKSNLDAAGFGALVAFCTVMISPYNYDYDLCVLALAAGLLAPKVLSRARSWEVAGLIALGWAGSANAFVSEKIKSIYNLKYDLEGVAEIKSLSAIFIVAVAVWTWSILRRTPKFEIVGAQA